MTRAFTLLVAVTGLACGADLAAPPADFSFAVATRDCGPTDGPAVTIYLADDVIPGIEPPMPYARITIWRSVAELEGTFDLVGENAPGTAYFQPMGIGFSQARRARIEIVSVRPDSTIQANVDLDFMLFGQIQGGITAPWISRVLQCG